MLERMKDLAKEGITMMAAANAMSLSIGRLHVPMGKNAIFAWNKAKNCKLPETWVHHKKNTFGFILHNLYRGFQKHICGF